MDGVHIANWSKSKRFNASMFASFVVAFVSSTAVAHYASDTSHHVNATAAVATDYAAYFGMFALAYYMLSRRAGEVESIRSDIVKLITSMGIAEAVYAVMRWTTHYYFLELGLDPYAASIVSNLISTAVYFAAANVAARITGLFKKKQ